MTEEPVKESIFRISRVSFMGNYIIGVVLLLYFFLSGLMFTVSTIITTFFLVLILIFFLEPEGIIANRKYIIDAENISEIKGVFTKKKLSIPVISVTGQSIDKGVIGRLLNYGDVVVSSHTINIKIKGMRNPERVYKKIETLLSNKR
jgi:membrane protein YdbS with pleckstrin-like domain